MPEFALLLLCARTRTDAVTEARIGALLQDDLDWDLLIRTAHQHRVLPLVYRTLRRLNAAVPEPAMERLRKAFQANVTRNLFLCGELLRLVELFREHRIRSIPYKGPIVASVVYGDISLRQFADLDIIVPAKDVARARALLVARGYRPENPLNDDELTRFISVGKDITLLHDELGLNVEIHWGITTDDDPIRVGEECLWERLDTYAIGGKSIQTFTPEDLLLILCIHGAKHRWERLVWLCDVAELARTPGALNWELAIDGARRLGSERILFLGLSLASELLGAELPPAVARAIQADAALRPISEQVKGWLSGTSPASLDLGERERYFMRLRERPADRFRVAIRQAKGYLALTSRDTERLPLPGLAWTLYLRRPARLVRQYGVTPFTRFCRGIFQS